MLDDKELCGFWQDVEKRYAKKSVSDLLTELAADVAMRWVSPAKGTEQYDLLQANGDLRKEMALLYHALGLIRDRVDAEGVINKPNNNGGIKHEN